MEIPSVSWKNSYLFSLGIYSICNAISIDSLFFYLWICISYYTLPYCITAWRTFDFSHFWCVTFVCFPIGRPWGYMQRPLCPTPGCCSLHQPTRCLVIHGAWSLSLIIKSSEQKQDTLSARSSFFSDLSDSLSWAFDYFSHSKTSLRSLVLRLWLYWSPAYVATECG